MTEEIQINRQIIYLTIDKVRIETNTGVQEQENQFVAFVKKERPNEINLGEQVKNAKGENVVFNSIEQAKEFVIKDLKKSIYPPDFHLPLHYKKEDLDELLHKVLIYDI